MPRIELIPLRPAVCSDAPLTLDVLVRILPAALDRSVQRPAINLGLVLDRSGSMAAEKKMQYARQAAMGAVQQLLPTDRVSVTTFDDVVETLVPSTTATDKAAILHLLRGIEPRGSTALHAGWVEGARQVSRHLLRGGLNRVLLLSDGLANVGQSQPGVIAVDALKWAQRGVSTSTIGVGHDYHEDLLRSMAVSGDGNYYHLESPSQLVDLFERELKGLSTTVGHKVSLGFEPKPGVSVAEVLNDLDYTEFGRLKLPNLIAGVPIEVLVRLNIAPVERWAELCAFRLAWETPASQGRQTRRDVLALPSVPLREWKELPCNPEVHERVTLLLLARLKLQATRLLEQGNAEGARGCVQEARQMLSTLPLSTRTEQETQAIAELESSLEGEDWILFAKRAKYQHYWQTTSRPVS
jgi:Ca-activated chloride channel family protein